jgi:hypothetical protein
VFGPSPAVVCSDAHNPKGSDNPARLQADADHRCAERGGGEMTAAQRRTPGDFGAAFRALLDAAGLGVDALLAELDAGGRGGVVSRSTVYDWRRGDHLPEDTRPLLTVIRHCLNRATRRGTRTGLVPGDEDGWLALLADAKQARDSRTARQRDDRSAPGSGRRPIGRWDAVTLGVHKAIGGGALPPYVRRAHDDQLYTVLDPAIAANRLVVLRGGSSTGKSRAAYQAVTARLPDWHLDYPRTPAALTGRLTAGIAPRTVVWLNELRHYADYPGGPDALAGLCELTTGTGPIIVITTVWPEFWTAYTTSHPVAPGTPDPTKITRDLLAPLPELSHQPAHDIDTRRGGVIDIPDQFTDADLTQARECADPVLTEAITAADRAGDPGQITQYLAGVPALLNHYNDPGADPYGKAVITAAMDATRLGHTHPCTAAMLTYAAIGYLTDQQRTTPIETWRDTALDYATRELKGAIRALEPVPPRHGTGITGYRLTDYLDQHARRHRADQIPPSAFWTALADHAHPDDLTRLGHAAHGRGLYRDAAQLLKKAAPQGNSAAAVGLVDYFHAIDSADQHPAQWAVAHVAVGDPRAVALLLEALWRVDAGVQVVALAERAAAHVALGDPRAVAALFEALQKAGAGVQATTLLARDPAAHVALDDPSAVALLLEALREVDAGEQVIALAERAAAHVALDDSYAVVLLLEALREVDAGEQVIALAERAAAHVALDDSYAVVLLLEALREVDAGEQVIALAERAAAHVALDDAIAVAELLETLQKVDAGEQIVALAERAATHVALDDSYAVALLLEALWRVDAGEQIVALAERAAAHVALNNPLTVGRLFEALREVDAGVQATTLLARDPAAHVALDDPIAVAVLLEALQKVDAAEQVVALAKRDPAAHVALDDPSAVALLLEALWRVDAGVQVVALAERAAAHVALDDPSAVALLLEALWRVDAGVQVVMLAERAAAHIALDNPFAVGRLLEALREVDAGVQVVALAERAAAHVALDKPFTVRRLLEALQEVGADGQIRVLVDRLPAAGMFDLIPEHLAETARFHFGREPSGLPASPWGWDDLP